MYLTEYMKAVHTDRKRRINIHSTHGFGSGMTEKGYDETNESVIDKRVDTYFVNKNELTHYYNVGKMIIDIEYNDDSNQSIEILSPVPTVTVTEWLDTNTLLDKTVLYEF